MSLKCCRIHVQSHFYDRRDKHICHAGSIKNMSCCERHQAQDSTHRAFTAERTASNDSPRYKRAPQVLRALLATAVHVAPQDDSDSLSFDDDESDLAPVSHIEDDESDVKCKPACAKMPCPALDGATGCTTVAGPDVVARTPPPPLPDAPP